MFDQIEKLKRDYTDQFVVVDASRPELRRFRDRTGQVKTVNMSGRALVQFDDANNIGWFDIDPDFLKVVDAPKKEQPADNKAPTAKKPIDKKPTAMAPVKAADKSSTADILAAARGKGAAPLAKPSTADVLEAARTKKGATATAAKPAAAGKLSTAAILAAVRGKGATAAAAPRAATPKADAPAAKPKAGKMNTADILAAARGKAPATAGAARATVSSTAETLEAARSPKAKPVAALAEPMGKITTADIIAVARGGVTPIAESAPERIVEPAAAEETAAPSPAAARVGDLPTETADIVAWCRQHDAK